VYKQHYQNQDETECPPMFLKMRQIKIDSQTKNQLKVTVCKRIILNETNRK
jgi:hypothetical protein